MYDQRKETGMVRLKNIVPKYMYSVFCIVYMLASAQEIGKKTEFNDWWEREQNGSGEGRLLLLTASYSYTHTHTHNFRVLQNDIKAVGHQHRFNTVVVVVAGLTHRISNRSAVNDSSSIFIISVYQNEIFYCKFYKNKSV